MGAAATQTTTASHKSLSGMVSAYSYAIFLVAGPWILMVIAIAGVSQAACPTNQCTSIDVFRSVVIYNFLFSLILAAPICLPLVRMVSDDMFEGNFTSILGAIAAALIIFAIAGFLLVGPFYAFAPQLPAADKIAAFENFMLMSAAWLIAPFLGSLLDYKGVSFAFLSGSAVTLAIAATNPVGDVESLLGAFSMGLGVTNAVMLLRLVGRLGRVIRIERRMFAAYRRYWQLGAIGLFYYLGIWVDNFIMWFAAPSGVSSVAGVFNTMPDYDTVMFWAQLTTIPVLAFFALHVETRLYDLNRQFQMALGRQASRREIDLRVTTLNRFVASSVITLFVTAIVIMVLVMLATFWGIDRLGLSAKQMGMMRAGLFGVAFHTTAMFCVIFMMFFDLRRAALIVAISFFLSNMIFTLGFMPLGFAYFGYGNLLAGAIALGVGFWLLLNELPWLCYHAFITSNVSLTRVAP